MRLIHPGEILKEELNSLSMSPSALAQHIGVPPNRICAIVNGRRSITADTALRLSQCFGTSPEFWMNLQTSYEIKLARENNQIDILKINRIK